MKQKDVALILVVVFFSAVISFVISGKLFNGPKNRQQTAEVVDVLSSDFEQPDSKYFNSAAVNPTQLIQIGSSTNPNPFGGTQ